MQWRTWSKMPRDTELPEFMDEDASKETYAAALHRFSRLVHCRIVWLTDRLPLLPADELAEAHYVLAELHDRLDVDVGHNIQKRGVRYHAIKALRLNKDHAAANVLLGYDFNWCGLIGQTLSRRTIGCSNTNGEREVVAFGKATSLMYLRRGIRYLTRATQLDPDNSDYARWLATARRELRITESDGQDCCSGCAGP